MTYTNGWPDGSGKGTILKDGKPYLRTHWGCNCCDNGPFEKHTQLADEVIKELELKQKLLNTIHIKIDYFKEQRDTAFIECDTRTSVEYEKIIDVLNNILKDMELP